MSPAHGVIAQNLRGNVLHSFPALSTLQHRERFILTATLGEMGEIEQALRAGVCLRACVRRRKVTENCKDFIYITTLTDREWLPKPC